VSDVASTWTRPNDPPVLILTSLAAGEKHGYALAQDIESFAGVVLGPGTLDGAITRLEERGLIEPVGESGRRRPYRLTAAGRAALAEALEAMRRVTDEGAARLRTGRAGTVGRRSPWRPAGGAA
jgi:DNA-binding PadR family transcriptional regulator